MFPPPRPLKWIVHGLALGLLWKIYPILITVCSNALQLFVVSWSAESVIHTGCVIWFRIVDLLPNLFVLLCLLLFLFVVWSSHRNYSLNSLKMFVMKWMKGIQIILGNGLFEFSRYELFSITIKIWRQINIT